MVQVTRLTDKILICSSSGQMDKKYTQKPLFLFSLNEKIHEFQKIITFSGSFLFVPALLPEWI
jgi:hypothetical protein